MASESRAATGGRWDQDEDGQGISVGGRDDRVSAEVVARVAPGAGVERVTYLSGSTVDAPATP